MKPKLFNEEEILNAVCKLFWKHGFDGTSMQMLEETTGLGRSSLYHSFENKNELFRRALKNYLNWVANQYQAAFDSADDVIDGLENLIKTLGQSGRDPSGCLLVLSTLELDQHQPQTKELLLMAHAQMRSVLFHQLEKAQKRGEISPDRNLEALTGFLYIFINGLLTANKVNYKLSNDLMQMIRELLI